MQLFNRPPPMEPLILPPANQELEYESSRAAGEPNRLQTISCTSYIHPAHNRTAVAWMEDVTLFKFHWLWESIRWPGQKSPVGPRTESLARSYDLLRLNTYEETNCRILHEGGLTLKPDYQIKAASDWHSFSLFLLAVYWIMKDTNGSSNGIKWSQGPCRPTWISGFCWRFGSSRTYS